MSKTLKRLIFYPMWWLRGISQGLLIFITMAFFLVGTFLLIIGIVDVSQKHRFPWFFWIYVALAFVIAFACYSLRMNYQEILYKVRPESGFPAPRFSPKVYQLAEEYGLGTPINMYRGRFVTRVTFFWMVMAVFYGGGGIWLLLTSMRSISWNSLVLFIFILPALWFIFYRARRLFWRVFVFSDGCAFLKNGKLYPFVWEEVDAIWQDVRRSFLNGALINTICKYTVELTTGLEIVFDSNIMEIQDLGTRLQNVLTRIIFPKVLAAYKNGEDVTFGSSLVNQQGLSFVSHRPLLWHGADSGTQQADWNQIKGIEVIDGGIWIDLNEKRKILIASVKDVPNFYVFIALVEAIKGGLA